MTANADVPLRRLMGFAVVQLGWSPETFWRATPSELYAAAEALAGEERQRSFAAFKRQFEPSGQRETQR